MSTIAPRVQSGKYGVVNGESTVENWTISETDTTAEARKSNTKAGVGRLPGIKDYTGTFEGNGGFPAVMPGDYFVFEGLTAPTTGALGTAGEVVTCDLAICEAISVNWNWETGELLGWTADFAMGDGTAPVWSNKILTDISTPTLLSPCGIYIEWTSDNTTYNQWANTVNATLNITSNNVTYVNVSTLCGTGRRPGIVDWTLDIAEHGTSPELSKTLSSVMGLRLQIGGGLFWRLDWGIVNGISDLNVNIATGDIIGYTTNLSMAGVDVAGSFGGQAGDIGLIARPDQDLEAQPTPDDPWWPTQYNAATLPATV